MVKSICMLLFTIVINTSVLADEPPVIYHEGFEGKVSQWKIWAKNSKEPCKINFAGTTSEKANTGKRSLKLDLTFKEGSYCYWEGKRVNIPTAGDLKLSGFIYVDQIPKGVYVALGRNISLPPSGCSGCRSAESIKQPTGKWQRFELDIGESTKEHASNLLGTDRVYSYMDRIAIMFRGKFHPGGRAVVYIDDLKITGHLNNNYEKEMLPLVVAEQKKQVARLQEWSHKLETATKRLHKLQPEVNKLSMPVRQHVQQNSEATRQIAEQLSKSIARKIKLKYWIQKREEVRWQDELASIQDGIGIVEELLSSQKSVADNRPYVLYTRQAITDRFLLPTQLPVAATPGDTVSLTATPGEYEPATFAIFACEKMDGVKLEASELRSGRNSLPASVMDIRIVKAWYQGSYKGIGAPRPGGKRYLVPELLLKDDALIRVDSNLERNFMRHQGTSGTKTYVDISDPDLKKMTDVIPRDARTLQPFEIPENSLKQIWVTAHIPQNAKPGNYTGTIQIRSNSGRHGEVKVQLRVLPFRLEPSHLVQSVYYHARLKPNKHRFKMNCNYRNAAQIEAELQNMMQHGLTSPTTYQSYDENLETVLKIRQRVGMHPKSLFTLGQTTGNSTDPKRLKNLQGTVKKWMALAKQYGYEDVYFYGFDEARGEKMQSQRTAWKAVRKAGGKTFTAGYYGSFEAVGDLQNLIIMPHNPDPEEAAKYHSVGHKIFSYANPQCGPEQPETFRRNFGLLLWKSNFDGAMDYAYHRGFGHIWNDFDHDIYRDHVMAYPTVDGVIDTLQWEGYREGVDDTRYLATLQKKIKEALATKRQVATAAQHWLDNLDIQTDLDTIRNKMIDWILKL